MGILTDVRPLKESPAYRRLWFGLLVGNLGQQMSVVAIAYEVYTITHSSFAVGLVGLAGLLPLIVGGLYGGALADAFDRRTVAIASALGLWASSLALVAHALWGLSNVGILYAIVALTSAMFAINQPARSSMLPRLLPPDLLPAANALGMASTNLGFTVGPLVGGLVIAWQGPGAVYGIDAVLYLAALYALFRLPPMPPLDDRAPAPGLRSVADGLRFLATAPNLRMTFIVDLCAMVLAQPRALFPALAITVYASGAGALGVLQSAPAIGSLLAFAVSGWISRVHRHGVAIVIAIGIYGMSVALVGVAAVGWPGLLMLAVVFLAFSGAADMVSAAYRSTMLQVAAPDQMRGRMQGVFIVVVAGGPRLGDFVIGSLAAAVGEQRAMVIGGVACVVGVLLAVWRSRQFLAYDDRQPTP